LKDQNHIVELHQKANAILIGSFTFTGSGETNLHEKIDMQKIDMQKKIDKNRDLIDRALSMEDTQMMYYIVRRLAKDNERLIAKLKE
jgi:hypothetical protein